MKGERERESILSSVDSLPGWLPAARAVRQDKARSRKWSHILVAEVYNNQGLSWCSYVRCWPCQWPLNPLCHNSAKLKKKKNQSNF